MSRPSDRALAARTFPLHCPATVKIMVPKKGKQSQLVKQFLACFAASVEMQSDWVFNSTGSMQQCMQHHNRSMATHSRCIYHVWQHQFRSVFLRRENNAISYSSLEHAVLGTVL